LERAWGVVAVVRKAAATSPGTHRPIRRSWPGREPLLALDQRSGRRIPRLRILDNEGRPIAGRDIALAPGPGASKRTRARFGAT